MARCLNCRKSMPSGCTYEAMYSNDWAGSNLYCPSCFIRSLVQEGYPNMARRELGLGNYGTEPACGKCELQALCLTLETLVLYEM